MAQLHRRRGDDGQSLIIAILILFVVAVLGVTALRLGTHDTQQSASNRKRVQAIAAAEAGINWYYSHIQTATPTSLGPCDTGTQTLDAAAGTTFRAQVAYYTATAPDGPPIPCDNTDPDVAPARALITSEGAVHGRDVRKMESLVDLIPLRGGALSGNAMFSQSAVTLAANVQVYSGVGTRADIYTNGNFSATTNDLIEGSVFAQGTVSLSGSGSNSGVRRNVWGGNAVTLSNSYPVDGTVRSATSISVGGPIGGDAISPSVTPANPNVAGQVRIENPGAPPTTAFQHFVYDEASWTAPSAGGYVVTSPYSDCTAARNFLNDSYPGLPAANRLILITNASCTFDINKKVALNGNLAIIHRGPINVRNNTGFTAPGGDTRILHLFAGAGSPGPEVCSAGAPGVSMASNNVWSSNIQAAVYAPGTVSFSSNGRVLDGQIVGCEISLSSNSHMFFYPVFVPGTQITGFNEDIVYTREVSAG